MKVNDPTALNKPGEDGGHSLRMDRLPVELMKRPEHRLNRLGFEELEMGYLSRTEVCWAMVKRG